jgi:hypothetical protein
MPFGGLLIAGGAAVAGGIAGSMADKSSQTSGLNISGASPEELAARKQMMEAFSQYGQMVQGGPGQSDVTAGLGAQRDLASMFGQYAQNGGMPTGEDISQSNGIANNLFGAQRVAQQQSFMDQQRQFNQRAALMGTNPNDPVFANKLAQEQTRQGAYLQGQQGSFAQQLALGQPERRLGFAQQQAGILGGLATQAMFNRQTLAAMGEGIMTGDRNFRLQSASHYGNTESGGGLAGALKGGLAGFGAGAGAASGLDAMGAFGKPRK